MRKIEAKMNQAIASGKAFKLDNTQVSARYRTPNGYASDVRLYGHHIVQLEWDSPCGSLAKAVRINLCGYNTVTTRSRLNAILKEFTPYAGIMTRKGQVKLVGYDSVADIPSNEWVAVPFKWCDPVTL